MKILRIVVVVFIVVWALGKLDSILMDDRSKSEKIVDRLTAQTAKEVYKKKQLTCVGTGGGMMEQPWMLAMSFDYHKEVSLDEARELVVSSAQTYLDNINASKKLRPYLEYYPFLPENVEITIVIWKPGYKQPDLDNIYFVALRNGTISYYLKLPEDYGRKLLHKETYQEALQKVDNLELQPAM